MRLLRMYLRSQTAELHRNNVRLRMIGSRRELAPDIIELIENAENLMKENTGLVLTMALNYGGRHEILQAAAAFAGECKEKGMEPAFETAEEYFPQFLMTKDLPDPDILIRTSGEQRISNFLYGNARTRNLSIQIRSGRISGGPISSGPLPTFKNGTGAMAPFRRAHDVFKITLVSPLRFGFCSGAGRSYGDLVWRLAVLGHGFSGLRHWRL